MNKECAARTLFGVLLPGDVLVHRAVESDTAVVLRVGTRLDFLHLYDGRILEAWVEASSEIPQAYDVVRGDEVIISNA